MMLRSLAWTTNSTTGGRGRVDAVALPVTCRATYAACAAPMPSATAASDAHGGSTVSTRPARAAAALPAGAGAGGEAPAPGSDGGVSIAAAPCAVAMDRWRATSGRLPPYRDSTYRWPSQICGVMVVGGEAGDCEAA
jgi:hypothetical protein